MNAAVGIKAYSNIGLESNLVSADPHKLVLMLYQGALLAIAAARNQIMRGETSAKGASISKAIMIIDEGLKASLNMEVGGEMAQNLADLYDYMSQRLLIANIKNDISALDEVSKLLSEIKGAWESISQPNVVPSTVAPAQPVTTNKQPSLVYGRR